MPELVEERSPNQKADLIFISKSTRQLFLMKNGEAFKEYRISLGLNPTGSKLYKGDFRTPEGLYTISAHEPNSDYHKALRISYPDKNDIKRANDLSKSPGGDIMIHGETNDPGILAKILEALGFENYEDISNDFIYRFNWTRGCIAVRNNEVEEIYNAVKDGTKIWIQP
ncbi:MAG: hypothetical protein A2504_13960 [Bdellovibrionales bacterium RIFOXYD12_FULL_39_22]|nr:MAG: hypothetical protein A2385_00685 [Bdellovibrionales bacterium RIFOXYB1_FULL_39_21]OFZ43892.1 MAG: hypothetical protein A2485_04845 [Bdellovibrionales bacterium RIFOXYC12_FULL_39_17]OFZ48873.1 MAG: hypothetical protein A2404_18000 [Bdellovibrionales bacterium RIFOXYC1_FULL_39_130]OFZ72436.1 MAG: hypothetical protein A2451_13750 [Bdellovibrionales bacterium RIFOXYC2_FULL_39_8]OFZ76606.1 MAG: hypothetical protein A2560_06665 [Bdellovibrionales bacterium RIFOXYD1_FULL_39_84]OFZ94840.1 MAG: